MDGERLRAEATEVLRGNDAGRYTIPASGLYPFQWNWDSAFCALGWATFDPPRAWTELESLAAAQDANGMLPHIAFRRIPPRPGNQGPLFGRLAIFHRSTYLPGPAWWGHRPGADGREISGITQPPVAATCMRLLFERSPDERRARALLAPFHRWHGFLLGERDPEGVGEPVLIHPWESGRDNAPEWDRPLFRVRARPMIIRRRDTGHVDAAQRPSSEHYKRYLELVAEGTNYAWDQPRLAAKGPFRVIDTAFSAILARACHDLAELAAALGEERIADASRARGERVAAAMRARARSDGRIPSFDLVRSEELDKPSVGAALATLAPGIDRHTVDDCRVLIAGALASDFGVRTLSSGGRDWAPNNYWRGPVWASTTWLAALGLEAHGDEALANGLRTRMVSTAESSGCREYFNPDSGRGLGANRFSWTAALALWEMPVA